MVSRTVSLWRLCRMVLHLLWGLVLATIWLPQLGAAGREKLVLGWTRSLLRKIGVKVTVFGEVPDLAAGAAMVVANHISWLDIWAINAVVPVRFVAKSEVRDWPLIGWLARRVGVIFIERARRNDTARVAAEGTLALTQGERLCVFPEGTTTDGTQLLPFRSSLLQSAVDAEAMLCPLAIRYPLPSGGVNVSVAYIGEITMLESLNAVFAQREVSVELHFLPPIVARHHDRRTLSLMSWEAINGQLHPAARAVPETHDGLPA